MSGGERRAVALGLAAGAGVGPARARRADQPPRRRGRRLARRAPEERTSSQAHLVVTHDRWFLDEVNTRTWEVHDGVVDAYEGGYSAYVLARAERDRMASTAEQKRCSW
jgi:hypothetical protein